MIKNKTKQKIEQLHKLIEKIKKENNEVYLIEIETLKNESNENYLNQIEKSKNENLLLKNNLNEIQIRIKGLNDKNLSYKYIIEKEKE